IRMMRSCMRCVACHASPPMSRLPHVANGETDHRTNDAAGYRPHDGRGLEIHEGPSGDAASHAGEHHAPRGGRPPQPAEDGEDGEADRESRGEPVAARLVVIVSERAELLLAATPVVVASPP